METINNQKGKEKMIDNEKMNRKEINADKNRSNRPLFTIHGSLFTIHYSLFTLGFRNLWRNKRRTIITVASVFFAVFFCTIMTCFSEGVWEANIDNTLRTQTGHIQVHAKGYWDDKIMDNFMSMDTETLTRLAAIDNVENVSPRVETFAMASFGPLSKGIAVIGISPEAEAGKSNLPVRLVEGDYLLENDDGILIGKGLSSYLKVNVGDTLALIGQGYHGVSAAGLFPVRGIFHFVVAEMDKGMAYITLPVAQQFVDMPNGYSGILIAVGNNNQLDKTIQAVEQTVDTQALDVLSWHFTMKRLLQTAESDNAFSKIMMYILYLIVGFGILGTVIMMTNERKREFVVMVSLGMQRRRLATVVATEILMMTLLGVALALAVTVPLAHLGAAHPIRLTGEMATMYTDMGMEPVLPMATAPIFFIKQILVVVVLTVLATVYPVKKVLGLKTVF
jgi:ABC-type lipoprotein release transport system permease subunit